MNYALKTRDIKRYTRLADWMLDKKNRALGRGDMYNAKIWERMLQENHRLFERVIR